MVPAVLECPGMKTCPGMSWNVLKFVCLSWNFQMFMLVIFIKHYFAYHFSRYLTIYCFESPTYLVGRMFSHLQILGCTAVFKRCSSKAKLLSFIFLFCMIQDFTFFSLYIRLFVIFENFTQVVTTSQNFFFTRKYLLLYFCYGNM